MAFPLMHAEFNSDIPALGGFNVVRPATITANYHRACGDVFLAAVHFKATLTLHFPFRADEVKMP